MAARLESRARLVYREQLIAIDAAMKKTSNANASAALRRHLAAVTCGAGEAVAWIADGENAERSSFERSRARCEDTIRNP